MEIESVYVSEELAGMRLDAGASKLLPYSRSGIAKAIAAGRLWLNARTPKARDILQTGDQISYDPLFFEIVPIRGEEGDLSILYEDDDLLVLNKEAGQITHPSPTVRTGTLVNVLLAAGRRLASGADPERPGIVHRLDAQTSGCLIIAKSDAAYAGLGAAFRAHRVKKVYLALVEGAWATSPSGDRIDLPLGRDPKDPKKHAIVQTGRPASSIFQTRNATDEASLMQVRILTGRTHQIRVHAKSAGHPVVGDTIYGYRRQRHATAHHLLHAWQLAFRHPVSDRWIHVQAPWDAEWSRVLKIYGIPVPGDDGQEMVPFDLDDPLAD